LKKVLPTLGSSTKPGMAGKRKWPATGGSRHHLGNEKGKRNRGRRWGGLGERIQRNGSDWNLYCREEKGC